ncbi:MAG: hypothetical protein J5902_04285 [Paludibacteraceae bacterium]|nr:hypothetical protein [Paludibacteraceae bacterium]MBQ9296785.1 hypothetical protein [Paludibacteraceae bacterium]
MTEREKMLAGEVYDACEAELLADINRNAAVTLEAMRQRTEFLQKAFELKI